VRNALPVPAHQYGNPGAGGTYNYWDEIVLNPPTDAAHATIDLLYQPTSWEYVQFLYEANHGQGTFLAQEGANLLDAWLNTGMAQPHVMASATWEWELPTGVELTSFAATSTDGGKVRLAWETASEVTLLGFHLYRAEAIDGSQIRLTTTLLPSQIPGSPEGAAYEFLDESVTAGRRYWYWLEDVDVYGRPARHGPVSVLSLPAGAHRIYLPWISR